MGISPRYVQPLPDAVPVPREKTAENASERRKLSVIALEENMERGKQTTQLELQPKRNLPQIIKLVLVL